MKHGRLIFTVLVGLLATVGLSGAAYAFHSGGVAECEGCHSMHSPADPPGGFLLVEESPSDTCLSCHENAAGDAGPTSYHISTRDADLGAGVPPKQRTPGGDFGWLKKTYTYTVRGTNYLEEGYTHGHNIVAPGHNYVEDGVNAFSPGGSFPADELQCTSCHNPHGQFRRIVGDTIVAHGNGAIVGSGSYATSLDPAANKPVGVYRILHGNGIKPSSTDPTIQFLGVPAAVVPGTYNRTEATTMTRVAYANKNGGGHVPWGTWCATCHEEMHPMGTDPLGDPTTNYTHPVDANMGAAAVPGPTYVDNYNMYVKSGDTSGLPGTSYLSLVPFIEDGTVSYSTLKGHAKNDNTYLNGPVAEDEVSCLSCHRAHASNFPEMLRFYYGNEFMTTNTDPVLWPGTDTDAARPQVHHGRNSTETAAAYYEQPATKFSPNNRALCNKCHVKD